MASSHALRFDPIEEAARHWRAHGWDAAAPGMALVTSVMRVQQIFLAATEQALRPFELTFARYEVLMLLLFSRRGRLPLGKVGERLQVHPASVTNAIDRLETQGFVRRVPNPRDGRGTLAEITPAGRKIARRATVAVNESVFTQVGVAPDDLTQAFRLLREIRRQAGDFVGDLDGDGAEPAVGFPVGPRRRAPG
jgi:DNA-binding MarR family transcriptional regulator